MATVTTPSYHQRVSYHAGLLAGVCCLISVLLIIGNMETEQRIADHVEADKQAMLAQVLPAGLYDNSPLAASEAFPAQGSFISTINVSPATLNGQLSAVVLQATVGGWGGDLQFILATNHEGEITGVRIISHKETPGLADGIEIEKSQWITTFNGKSLHNLTPEQWAVKKDGGSFDQFTGATITPRAVVNGVYQSLQFIEQWQNRQGVTDVAGAIKSEKSANSEAPAAAEKSAAASPRPSTPSTPSTSATRSTVPPATPVTERTP